MSTSTTSLDRTPAGSPWAIVLAAGDGTRLRELTTPPQGGRPVPKQYCSLRGGPSLVQSAVYRAAALAPLSRIVIVVAGEHEQWWRPQLAALPAHNVIVQPSNRGTAPGLLLPLLEVLAHDQCARVAVLPSDHWVRSEPVLVRALRGALAAAQPETVTLLGITPDAPEAEYGWVVPEPHTGAGPARVRAFEEKPPLARARALLDAAGLWNSFLLAARGSALRALCELRLGALAHDLARAHRGGAAALALLYRTLPVVDFSRAVLAPSTDALRLWRVPDCGWTDLGTPRRVAECLASLGAIPRASHHRSGGALDLDSALRRVETLPARPRAPRPLAEQIPAPAH